MPDQDGPDGREDGHQDGQQDGQQDGPKAQDDLKARMREALARKRSNDPGVSAAGHKRGKAPETHGPLGGVHMHRRKSGGGGS